MEHPKSISTKPSYPSRCTLKLHSRASSPDALVVPAQREPVLAAQDRPSVLGHGEVAPRGRREFRAPSATLKPLELNGWGIRTEIRYKAGPRLRDLASWAPLAAGASSRNLGPIL